MNKIEDIIKLCDELLFFAQKDLEDIIKQHCDSVKTTIENHLCTLKYGFSHVIKQDKNGYPVNEDINAVLLGVNVFLFHGDIDFTIALTGTSLVSDKPVKKTIKFSEIKNYIVSE